MPRIGAAAVASLALLGGPSVVEPGPPGVTTSVAAPRSTAAGTLFYLRDVRPPAGGGEWFSQIFRAREDGTLQRQLTRRARADHDEADVSRDGRRIVFTRFDGNWQTLWLIAADGSGLRRLIGSSENPRSTPRWSPDARRIAAQSEIPCPNQVETHAGCAEIVLIEPGKPGVRRLAETFVGVAPVDMSWSPGSRSIAFEHRPGNDASYVALVDVEGGGVRMLARGFEPVFASSGDLLAFVNEKNRIAVMRADGSIDRLLPPPPRGWVDSGPSWSPDGNRIAFWRLSRHRERGRLLVVDLRISTVRSELLAFRDAPFARPTISWSPDGSNS